MYLIASLHECACLRELIREELQVKRTIIGEYYSFTCATIIDKYNKR